MATRKLSEITKELLAIHNRFPRKKLGQNFLINQEVLSRIVSAAELSKEDTVVEVGTGLGVLTNELAEKSGKVITIEYDTELLKISKDILHKHTNIEYIAADILKWKPRIPCLPAGRNFAASTNQLTPYKMVSNLPYYIAAPIIAKFLETENKPELMVLTIQKEVAERIASKPGTKKYGSFSIFCQFYGQVELISLVPKFAFYPQPNVSSAIIKITPYKESPWGSIDKDKFFKIVRAAFQQRRKKLRNSLEEFNIDPDKFDLSQRPEQLSVEEFVKLANV